jgi:hypothetical protein
MAALHFSQIGLTLPTNDPATPIKESGRIEPLVFEIFHKTGHNVTAKLSRHIRQHIFSSPRKILRQAGHIHIFTSTLFQEPDGMAHILRVIEFWIGFPLNQGNSNGFLHGAFFLSQSLETTMAQDTGRKAEGRK